jgi:hypothetical protein
MVINIILLKLFLNSKNKKHKIINLGLMVLLIKDITQKVKSMVKAITPGLMVLSTLENGQRIL